MLSSRSGVGYVEFVTLRLHIRTVYPDSHDGENQRTCCMGLHFETRTQVGSTACGSCPIIFITLLILETANYFHPLLILSRGCGLLETSAYQTRCL